MMHVADLAGSVSPPLPVSGQMTSSSEAPASLDVGRVSTCRICRSSKRATIDAAIVSGGSVRAVGDAYGFSKSAIARHGATCLPAKVARANAQREDEVTAATLLDAMVTLQQKTIAKLDAIEHTPSDFAKLSREVRENVVTMGRFIGAFAGEGAKNVDNRVQVLALRDMTVDELRALTSALRSKVAQ